MKVYYSVKHDKLFLLKLLPSGRLLIEGSVSSVVFDYVESVSEYTKDLGIVLVGDL